MSEVASVSRFLKHCDFGCGKMDLDEILRADFCTVVYGIRRHISAQNCQFWNNFETWWSSDFQNFDLEGYTGTWGVGKMDLNVSVRWDFCTVVYEIAFPFQSSTFKFAKKRKKS